MELYSLLDTFTKSPTLFLILFSLFIFNLTKKNKHLEQRVKAEWRWNFNFVVSQYIRWPCHTLCYACFLNVNLYSLLLLQIAEFKKKRTFVCVGNSKIQQCDKKKFTWNLHLNYYVVLHWLFNWKGRKEKLPNENNNRTKKTNFAKIHTKEKPAQRIILNVQQFHCERLHFIYRSMHIHYGCVCMSGFTLHKVDTQHLFIYFFAFPPFILLLLETKKHMQRRENSLHS